MRNCLRKAACTRAFMICSITFRTEKGPAAGQLLRTEPQSRLSLTRIPQLRSTKSARRNPSAAKSMGFCL